MGSVPRCRPGRRDQDVDLVVGDPEASRIPGSPRAALEIWREGSGRRDAVYHQPGRITMGSVMNLIEDAAVLAGMAAPGGLAARGRRRADEAWDWYRAILRCSRLIGRHGYLLQRITARGSTPWPPVCILRWAADPRVGAGPLRRALHDTLAADALTPPVSEAVKIDYLSCLKSVENMRRLREHDAATSAGRSRCWGAGKRACWISSCPGGRETSRSSDSGSAPATSWSGPGACSDCCSPTGWRRRTGRLRVRLRWRCEDRPGSMPTTRPPPPRPAP